MAMGDMPPLGTGLYYSVIVRVGSVRIYDNIPHDILLMHEDYGSINRKNCRETIIITC